MANSANGLLARMGGDAGVLCRRAWWVFLASGILAVLFGVLAFSKPLAAWAVVATFFAAAILVDGLFNAIGAIQHREKDGWWILLLLAVLGIVVGGYALLHPLVSMMAFVYLVAFQAIVAGAFLVMLGYKVRAATQREWILYLTGALSMVFGVIVIGNPAAGGLSVIWLIATWAVVTGVLRIVFALRVKNVRERPLLR